MRSSYLSRRRAAGFRIAIRDDEIPAKDDVPQDGVPNNGLPSGQEPEEPGEEEEEEDDDDEEGETSDDDDELSSDDDDEGEEEELDTPIPTTTTTTSSSTPASISSGLPATTFSTTTTTPTVPSSSTATPPIANLPAVSSIPVPILNPTDVTTETITSDLAQGTNSAQLDVPFEDKAGSSTINNSKRDGEIAGATIGSIALLSLLLLGIWFYRRRRRNQNQNQYSITQISGLPTTQQIPTPERTPSSIMNQLMTAAYAAEDSDSTNNNSRNEQPDLYYYTPEKEFFTAHENESTERLTVPEAARMRHQSIAARTETTSRTESTWKTWGVLARPPPTPGPHGWWVDRYFRS